MNRYARGGEFIYNRNYSTADLERADSGILTGSVEINNTFVFRV